MVFCRMWLPRLHLAPIIAWMLAIFSELSRLHRSSYHPSAATCIGSAAFLTGYFWVNFSQLVNGVASVDKMDQIVN